MGDLRKIAQTKKPSCIVMIETGGLLGMGKDLNFKIRGYDAFPNDRNIGKKGGGTIIWVKKDISSSEASIDSEQQKNLGAAELEQLQGERQ